MLRTCWHLHRNIPRITLSYQKIRQVSTESFIIPSILFLLFLLYPLPKMKARLTALLISLLQINQCTAYAPLAGVTARSVKTQQDVDLSNFLNTASSSDGSKTMLVMGTYAADFNAIEYAQRLRYYLPELKKRGVGKIGLVLNCKDESAKALADLVDLPCDISSDDSVTLMVDPLGKAGVKFGVGRGWRPDDTEMSPYVKLFGMLWGLGVSAKYYFHSPCRSSIHFSR